MKRTVPVFLGKVEVGTASIDEKGKIIITIDLENIDHRVAGKMHRMLTQGSTKHIQIDEDFMTGGQ